MTIFLPSQNGIIVRKSSRTVDAINALRHLNRGMERNDDAHLAGFWLGGNGHDVHHSLENTVLAHGLRQGVDFVR